MPRIRIKKAPGGEVPSHIRAAWVGCEFDAEGPWDWAGLIGIVSGEPTGQFVHDGFRAKKKTALAALAIRSPEAARWFRENAHPNLEVLIFFRDECEVIQEGTPVPTA